MQFVQGSVSSMRTACVRWELLNRQDRILLYNIILRQRLIDTEQFTQCQITEIVTKCWPMVLCSYGPMVLCSPNFL